MKMRIIFSIAVLAVVVSFMTMSTTTRAETEEIDVFVDGIKVSSEDFHAYYKDGTSYVPLRSFLEHVGAGSNISWEGVSKTATLIHNGMSLEVSVGKKTMLVNNDEIVLPAAAELVNSVLYIPVRPLCDLLGYYIGWDPLLKRVHVGTTFADQSEVIVPGDNVFLAENLSQISNTDYYVPNGGRFLLSNPPQDLYYYSLNESLFTGLNKKAFNLTKILLLEDAYTSVIYDPQVEKAFVGISASKEEYEDGQFNLRFVLPEKGSIHPKEEGISSFSVQSIVKLELNGLSNTDNMDNQIWVLKEYDTRLRDALVYLFGTSDGNAMYKDLFNLYIGRKLDPRKDLDLIYHSKEYDHSKVNVLQRTDGSMSIYFSK